ncbi:hypothetical protein BH11PSE10_BH11PSE10_18830 [soil metagenome]
MSKQFSPLSQVAAAVGAVLISLSSGASADAVVLTADTTASASGVNATPVPSSAAGYVGSSANQGNTLGQGYGYSFARDNGAYAVSANATGIATATAAASFMQSLINSSGMTQHYSMSFHIYHGYMSTALSSGASLSGAEFLKSQYMAAVSVNGSTVFDSSATVIRNATGSLGSKSGVDLNPGDDATDGELSWSDLYYTIDLGNVASGGSINVLASLKDETSSNVGTYTFDGGCCSDGYGCPTSEPGQPSGKGGGNSVSVAIGCTTSGFKGQASAFYGDPIDFFASAGADAPPNGAFIITASDVRTDVPEPGALGLTALALGAAGWVGRRRIHRD